ncbi:MAG: O-antigen ligase family protein [Odoribacter sp.]|nr:O-antigen ligase family protein [Odoribacter sp.]
MSRNRVLIFTEITLRFIVILWGITESVYGCLQLYDFMDSNHHLYKLTGSFQNPGPYGGFLASILPLALWQALENKSSDKHISQVFSCLSWGYIFLCCILLPATLSRASWLAATIGCGIVIVAHYKASSRLRQFIREHRQQSILWFCLFCLLAAAATAGIYYLKKDSADGRLLMWKVTTRIIAGHPFFGVGKGNFTGAYGQAQAAYFAEGTASAQEEYVAGCPEYAFNEFLQIAAENGLFGLTLFLAVLLLAFRQAARNQQTGIIGSLTALLIFACFSYPFSVRQLSALFILLLLMPVFQKKRAPKNIYALAAGILLVAIPWAQEEIHLFKKRKAVQAWHSEQSFYNMEIYEGTVNNYRALYPELPDEPKFLFELGQCLAKTGNFQESNRILQEGAVQSSDPMFWNVMGKNYQHLCHFREAEQCFLHAYHMVPNRLYPLYLLANLYFACGQEEKGIRIAQQVIDTSPKVMSSAIQEMKAEMKEKLKIHSNGRK